MALLITPKTTQKALKQLQKYLKLNKIPTDEASLELGNFNDNFYFTKVGRVPLYVILTGYSGASVGFAVAQYEKNYKAADDYPVAYFLGSILKAHRAKHLRLADILYAKDTYGADEWTQAIYKNAAARGLKNIGKPGQKLVARLKRVARSNGITLKSGKILCRWHPGILTGAKYVIDLLDDGMWWEFALSEGKFANHDFDGGEIECASFLATCKLAKIPAVALLDVRDERYDKSTNGYRMADDVKKAQAQENMVSLIKESLKELDSLRKSKGAKPNQQKSYDGRHKLGKSESF